MDQFEITTKDYYEFMNNDDWNTFDKACDQLLEQSDEYLKLIRGFLACGFESKINSDYEKAIELKERMRLINAHTSSVFYSIKPSMKESE